MARVNPHASSLSAESTSNTASSKENAGGLFSKLARNIRTFKLFTTPAKNASRQSCTEGNKSVQNKSIDHQRIRNSQETKNNVSSLGKMKPIPAVSCSSYEEYQTAIEEVPSPGEWNLYCNIKTIVCNESHFHFQFSHIILIFIKAGLSSEWLTRSIWNYEVEFLFFVAIFKSNYRFLK